MQGGAGVTHPLKAPVRAGYLEAVFSPHIFSRLVEVTARRVVEIVAESPFDVIAFRGVSGAAMAFPLAHVLSLPIYCVRKHTENSHALSTGAGVFLNGKRYLIVDDFIDTGSTINTIVEHVNEIWNDATCVGVLEYLTPGERSALNHSHLVSLRVWANPGYEALMEDLW